RVQFDRPLDEPGGFRQVFRPAPAAQRVRQVVEHAGLGRRRLGRAPQRGDSPVQKGRVGRAGIDVHFVQNEPRRESVIASPGRRSASCQKSQAAVSSCRFIRWATANRNTSYSSAPGSSMASYCTNTSGTSRSWISSSSGCAPAPGASPAKRSSSTMPPAPNSGTDGDTARASGTDGDTAPPGGADGGTAATRNADGGTAPTRSADGDTAPTRHADGGT